MFIWGLIVFIGLWLVFSDLKPVHRAKLMGNPFMIHAIVLGTGFWLHGGSANGAMAAVVSGVFSALYVRLQRRMFGYIKRGQWYPGRFRTEDPRRIA